MWGTSANYAEAPKILFFVFGTLPPSTVSARKIERTIIVIEFKQSSIMNKVFVCY
jgi:hypothetical protein